jgi:kynurenine formamidase
MTVYDLSVPILDGVDWYHEADCPAVALREVGSLPEVGWRSHTLSLMVLNGTTYLETAAHLYEDAPTLDDLPPQKFVTRAFVVQLSADSQELPAPECRLKDFQEQVDSLLLSCGWDAHLHDPDYYHASPYFSPALQDWLLEHRPVILGGDMLSFDHPADETMPFLREFFRGGGMILCPLVGLYRLPETVTLCTAPLKLAGANAAPCRVLAW